MTQDFLWASDGDSEEELLLFLLARSPSRGQLQRGGQPTDRFSQHDLQQGLVYYVHTGEGAWPRSGEGLRCLHSSAQSFISHLLTAGVETEPAGSV